MISFAKYTNTDFGDCLEVIKSNVPRYFTSNEYQDFERWLGKMDCPNFYLLKLDGQVIGFGGFYKEESVAKLAWGVIHANYHGKGYGKAMLEYRLETIRQKYGNIDIRLDTTQLTCEYFEKFGFKSTRVIPKYYDQTFDKHEMVLKK